MNKIPVYVFDLDGVITDPSNSQVSAKAVGHIHTLLHDGFLVAVNTGRSYPWVRENLLQELEQRGASETFDRLYIVCEKGGESIIWQAGAFTPQPSRFALTDEAHHLSRQVFDDNRAQLQTMFWDDTKQTMATLEKEPSAELEAFQAEQQVLAAKLREALTGKDVKIDATTIAIDVESPLAGKHAGAELIYEWISRHIDHDNARFVCFGDSKSDYEMARYFAQQQVPCEFIFVGPHEVSFVEEPGVALHRTVAQYAAGTLEYFASPVAA